MKKGIFILLAISLATSVYILASSDTDSIYHKVQGFGIGLPQEKVYLHLDNTCYFVGDTIWYKGYVTRSDKGTLTDLSKILYVELLTPDGFLVERQQLEMPNGTANGAFVLTDSLYAGYYELRAYTRWMLNFGQYEHPHAQWSEDAFYNKEMAKDFFRDYEKLYSRVFPVYDKPKETGHYTKDMTLRPLRRYFKARKGKPELELKFYPEGGNLVSGTDCNVALELNTEEGEHLENVEIDILDPQGRKITKTRTGNRGRCTFLLNNVGIQEEYKAVFQYKGYDYEVKLPEVEEEGIALQVRQDTLLKIELQRSEGLTDFPEGLALQVMAQGVPQTLQHIDFGDKRNHPVERTAHGSEPNHSIRRERANLCRQAVFRQPPRLRFCKDRHPWNRTTIRAVRTRHTKPETTRHTRHGHIRIPCRQGQGHGRTNL